ncbi:hypothetical protein F5B20DRAFT_582002 [Whalleya microplaca]|nr:hypothetical protein F5B20DRAFT_582002 [Whalleya microplaca]
MAESHSPSATPESASLAEEHRTEASWTYLLVTTTLRPFTYIFNKMKLLPDVWNLSPKASGNSPTTAGIEQFAQENAQLAAFWKDSSNPSMIFAALDVHAWDGNREKIMEIGLSTWTPVKAHKTQCFHWKIEGNVELQNRYLAHDADIFLFGASEVIAEPDIEPILSSVFESLAMRFKHVVIVGHGIDSTLELLKRYWNAPMSMTVLDTQKIWQFQHQELNQVSFEKALRTTPGANYNKYVLQNAGNDARYTINLLRALGEVAQHFQHRDHIDHEHFAFPPADPLVW